MANIFFSSFNKGVSSKDKYMIINKAIRNNSYIKNNSNSNKSTNLLSNKNSKDKISFKGVSIANPEKAATESTNVFDRAKQTIESYMKRQKSFKNLEDLDDLEDIEREANRKREAERNKWLNWDMGKNIRAIDNEERRAIASKFKDKGEALQRDIDRAKQAQKCVDNLPEQLAKLDPEKDIKRNKELEGARARRAGFKQKKGFSRIAGYEEAKAILDEFFIKKIKNEQNGIKTKIDGSVLFFGPTGNGKTTFAKAFAEETNCKISNIRPNPLASLKEQQLEFWDELKEEAENAEKSFKKDNKRTIIFADEVDKAIGKNSCILSKFHKFLKECSATYHCTVFATTNHPFNLGLDMSKETNFPIRVSINPPNKADKKAVLKHYLQGLASKNTDYKTLVNALEEKERNEKAEYSNSQIENICITNDNQESNMKDILGRIKEVKPAIDKAALDKFNREEAYFMQNKIHIN